MYFFPLFFSKPQLFDFLVFSFLFTSYFMQGWNTVMLYFFLFQENECFRILNQPSNKMHSYEEREREKKSVEASRFSAVFIMTLFLAKCRALPGSVPTPSLVLKIITLM